MLYLKDSESVCSATCITNMGSVNNFELKINVQIVSFFTYWTTFCHIDDNVWGIYSISNQRRICSRSWISGFFFVIFCHDLFWFLFVLFYFCFVFCCCFVGCFVCLFLFVFIIIIFNYLCKCGISFGNPTDRWVQQLQLLLKVQQG